MLGKSFAIMCIIAVLFGIFSGNGEKLGTAAIDGAAEAVRLTISLCGIMCFWTGIMNLLHRAGVIKIVSRILSPFMRIFFPETFRSAIGKEEICSNISANILGIGNAATPLAIAALKKMQEQNYDKATATDDMITLTVLNTASFSLVPSTLIALRNAAGAEDPFAIVPPVWICSAATSLFALLLTRMCASAFRRKNIFEKDLRDGSRSIGREMRKHEIN